MANSWCGSLPLLILLLLLCTVTETASVETQAADLARKTEKTLSAHDLLRSFGFPPGILPSNLTGYTLSNDGTFIISFSSTCKFNLEAGYTIRYRKTVSGRIQQNSITNIKGISVKIFIFWLDITQVDRDNNDLTFHAGILSQSFQVSNFEQIPQCGCGFSCLSDSGFFEVVKEKEEEQELPLLAQQYRKHGLEVGLSSPRMMWYYHMMRTIHDHWLFSLTL